MYSPNKSWTQILQSTDSQHELQNTIFQNYEQLGPIPQGIRVHVWHDLIPPKHRLPLDNDHDLEIDAMVDQIFYVMCNHNDILHSKDTRECFSQLFQFLFNALHNEFAEHSQIDFKALHQFKQTVAWLFSFCYNSLASVQAQIAKALAIPQKSNKKWNTALVQKVVSQFIRDTLETVFISFLFESPALLITLFDSIFIFQGDILFRLFLELVCEFSEPFREQAELIELDSGGMEIDNMESVIKRNYVQEIKSELYERLMESVNIGNLEVCKFNAIMFRLSNLLVRQKTTASQCASFRMAQHSTRQTQNHRSTESQRVEEEVGENREEQVFQSTLDEIQAKTLVSEMDEKYTHAIFQDGATPQLFSRSPTQPKVRSQSKSSFSFQMNRSFSNHQKQINESLSTAIHKTPSKTYLKTPSKSPISTKRSVQNAYNNPYINTQQDKYTEQENCKLVLSDAKKAIGDFLTQFQNPLRQALITLSQKQNKNEDNLEGVHDLKQHCVDLQEFVAQIVHRIDAKFPKRSALKASNRMSSKSPNVHMTRRVQQQSQENLRPVKKPARYY